MRHDNEPIHKDPVCGMRVSPEAAVTATVYLRKQYYFCSDHCREAFEVDPERYLYHPTTAAEFPQDMAISETPDGEAI